MASGNLKRLHSWSDRNSQKTGSLVRHRGVCVIRFELTWHSLRWAHCSRRKPTSKSRRTTAGGRHHLANLYGKRYEDYHRRQRLNVRSPTKSPFQPSV